MTNDIPIFRFSKSQSDWHAHALSNDLGGKEKMILGGKGAALVKMVGMGLNVPPGFTITTDVCKAYHALSPGLRQGLLDNVLDEAMQRYGWLTEVMGYAPLVSVRSGAPISMPGMMDTILNVGLVDSDIDESNFKDWCQRIGEKPTLDSMRRLIQMLGCTAFGITHDKFEFMLAKAKKEAGVKTDAELSKKALVGLLKDYKYVFYQNVGTAFPQTVKAQLGYAIRAVFESWNNKRAIEYRKLNNIPDDMGTAVTVQCMVFGNMGEDSGSGVLFTRDPSTGQREVMAEYLSNAQGEDVVAGIRTPDKLKLDQDGSGWVNVPQWSKDLWDVCVKLEKEYRDMVDVEFTVQKGELFILQSRNGKRSARAAFQIAHDLVNEGVIGRKEALSRLTKAQFKIVRRPSIDPKFKEKPHRVGLPACPGVVSGKPVFSSEDAINCTEPCILVTHETTPEDITGMAKAVGILTQTGGATSHAAVVARAMDKACIVGCTDLDIKALQSGAGHTKITIDGSTGNVWLGVDVPVIDASDSAAVQAVMQWCCEDMVAATPAVLPKGDQLPQVVQAVHWWNDTDVLDVVIDELVQLPSREHVVLDAAGPDAYRPDDDKALENVFSAVPTNGFGFHTVIEKALHKHRAQLAGLTVVNLPEWHCDTLVDLRKAGLIVPRKPQTVADILAGATDPSDDFIKNVIGGQEAWVKMQQMLATAGVKAKPVPKALPAEYCTFTMLQ